MRGTKMLMAVLAAGTLTLGAGMARAASWTSTTSEKGAMTAPQAAKRIELRGITGKVIAVDPGAKTLMVKGVVVEGHKTETVSVKVNDKSKVRQGMFHKTLANIQPGNHVWMVYQGTAHNWVADDVHILDPVVAVKGIEGPDVRT